MLKVVIVDDEERICQLIRALVDWDDLGMEVAGMANNGLDALELVNEIKPEILITDIRMPGCSGLELLEKVKEKNPSTEIIIISGYAHFEYAQRAIKYGVGDYLLKPINKTELNAILQKLKERIVARQESENDILHLKQKSENNNRRLQLNLMEQLIEQKVDELSIQTLQTEYYLKVQEGAFQAFWIKVDNGSEELSPSGLNIVMDKVENLIESNFRPKCHELLMCRKGFSYIGVMNYQPDKAEEIKHLLRDCLKQLEAQKDIYGAITFTGAVGGIKEKSEQLAASVYEASVIIKERLVVNGHGRVLEKMPSEGRVHELNLPEKYLRMITQAIEVMSVDEADDVIIQIQSDIERMQTVHGYEVQELVMALGRLFLSRLQIEHREAEIRKFEEKCECCGSGRELFDRLAGLQRECLEELVKQHENDAVRPIRQAKQYIQQHFSEQITLEEVSGVVGLNAAYFSVLFKKSEGEGFAKYLINLRIEEAKRLLRESNDSVAEICRKVGYNDLKHFTHTFEKTTGIKPATYRKLYG